MPLKRGSKLHISPSGIPRGPARSLSQHSYLSCLSPHSQVWPEIQDPLRATLCPFSHGTFTLRLGSRGLGHRGS